MATGYLVLPIPGGVNPDASGTGNNPMTPSKIVGSGTQTTNAPKATEIILLADQSTDEHWMWAIVMPGNYASGGLLRVVLESVSTSSGNVILKGAVAQSTDSSTNLASGNTLFDTVTVSAAIANQTTVGLTISGTVTLTGGYTANRFTIIMLGRDADNASDTLAADVGVAGVILEYTTT